MPDLFDAGHVSGASYTPPIAGAPAVIENVFEGVAIRIVVLDGEPWFVGKDVAGRLGYSNPQKAVRDHCRKPKPVGGERSVHPSALDPQTVIIAEPDVLRLIVGSKLPAAERFERWIFENVLPSIRRTGSYGAPRLDDPRALRQALLGYTERVIALEERLSITEPRSDALERLAGRKGSETITDTAKALKMRPSDLFAWLRDHKWLFRVRDGAPWRAYQAKIDQGYLLHIESPDPNRSDRSRIICRVTPKGRARIAELLETEKRR